MNRRLIDASKFRKYLADIQLANRGWKEDFCDLLDDVMEALDDQPTVDAVPIPCKLGQMVYEVVYVKNGTVSHINPMKVVGIHVGDFPDLRGHKRKSYLVVTHPTSDLLGRVPIDKIGKTVFMTKESAEAAAYPCEHCFSGTYRSCDGCSYGEKRL